MLSIKICQHLVRSMKNFKAQTYSTLIWRRKSLLDLKSDVTCNVMVFSLIESFAKRNRLCTSPYLLAKGKDKKKEKGKKKIIVDDHLLSIFINPESLREAFHSSITSLKEDFIKNVSLRSATGAIEMLPVKYEGEEFLVQDLAQINRKNPKTIVLNLNSFPQAIPAVLESLRKSGMDLDPQQDGTTVFIPVPKVTKEHREHLSKNAKTLFNKYKDHIKDTQNKYLKKIKNKESEGGVSIDQIHEALDMVSHIAQAYISEAEKILEVKQKELKGAS